MPSVHVHIAPRQSRGIIAAVERAGGVIAPPEDADAIVWLDSADAGGLGELLERSPARWIQLPFAGIEEFFAAGVIDSDRTWTCAKVAYGATCAELALTLIGVAARSVHRHVLERKWWRGDDATHRRIAGSTAVILGTGGIGTALAEMLVPLHVRMIGVNRSGASLPHAGSTVTDLASVAGEADWLVVTAALTPKTRHIVGADVLARMKPDAWIINVARGGLVDTDALVSALERGTIAGAALDVTDPEPLPDDHSLWQLPNVVITSHTANTWAMATPELAAMVERNVRAFAAGEPLEGLVDTKLGY